MIHDLATTAGAAILLPLFAALVLGLVPSWRVGAIVNAVAATLTFAVVAFLPASIGQTGPLLLVDRLAVHLSLLTAFVAMTASWFSTAYVRVEVSQRRLNKARLRQYHAMFQLFCGALLAVLLSNNLGITWVAIEAATIAAALVIGLPRTAHAVEASWKFFVLCGAGIALALFGTTVLYLAALPALGPGLKAMSWTGLRQAAPTCDGAVLNLAFVFLLLGYGTKAALAPLHAWMPDAHAEGPTPMSAILSGSVLNVALFVILRLRGVMKANHAAIDPAFPLVALGLLSVLLAAFSLWPRRDVKRFFSYSSVEHAGVAAFAFGIGGPAATFAGLLHMTVHTLTKSATFQCVGRAAQMKGGQRFADITGLMSNHRALGLSLAACVIALAGLPPFGLFSSEFLVALAAVRASPWLAAVLLAGLVIAAWVQIARLQSLCLGPATADPGPVPPHAALVPVWLHLALVRVLGLAMPGAVFAWFTSIAQATP